jgi:anti-sigma B factor antagonist
MDINVRTEGPVTVVAVAGELTWKSVPEAQTQILAAAGAGERVLLDMSLVPYMSSAGLRLLLVVYRTITGRGGRVLLAGLSPELTNTMALTGFLDFFKHRGSVEAGLAELAS